MQINTMVSLLFTALALLLFTSCVAEKTTVYIAGFYPDSFVISAPGIPYTSQYTENQINNNSLGLLKDYNLKFIWKNTLCIEAYALEAFIEFLRDDSKRYLVLLGPACSDPAAGIAQLSHFYGLTLFTYSSRSPALGNTDVYPGFIRANPSDANIVAGWMKFIQHYNWRRLAILNQQGDYFLSTSQEAQVLLQELGIDHYVGIFDPQSIRFDDQVETLLKLVDTQGYRILIINAYPNTLVKVLCHLKKFPALYPPSTTIFLYGWYGSRWYGDPTVTTKGECNLADIQMLTNGAIAFNSLPRIDELINSTDVLYSGKTPTQVHNDIREYVSEKESEEFFESEFRIEEIYLYDTMWALALALNKTIEMGYDLANVGSYNASNAFNNELNKNIIGLDFLGWSGQFRFVGNERYDGRIHFLEFVNGSLEFRGHMRNVPSNFSNFIDTRDIVIDYVIPFVFWDPNFESDGISSHPVHVVIFPLILFLSFVATIYVTVIIITILVCWYKRLRPVTTSEPVVTITILSGTYFLFILAVMLPLDGRYVSGYSSGGGKVFCQSRTWLLAVSISIIFGGMLAKAGKFYIIVIKQRFDFSDHLKPIYIVMFPLFLVLSDIIYFIIWLFASPKNLVTHEIESGLMNPPLYIVTECIASNSIGEQGFLWVLIAFKSVLVVIGLFLAYNLRKVTHKSLKYTGTITWTMYNTSICSLGIVLILLLVDNLELRYSLSALLSVIEGAIAASIIGGPIIYYIIRDPNGDTFFNPGNKDFPEGKDMLEMRIQALVRDNETMKRELGRKSTCEPLTNTTYEQFLEQSLDDPSPIKGNC
ncbi:gamma-aminobutyric acid type B receptor subunit 1 [Oopsacas minuta]|uniref:Gamma-aminobutyric acid type B receptor subunit 1 n=1 Tax=Oopsacas minuta TaxID=111878 RepID=A0AAV7JZ98_9METZ|nr:gamma-aminobutyric acid type B receptor subunit 1 [Oopsacas minuta]